jgi:hypothetical protein
MPRQDVQEDGLKAADALKPAPPLSFRMRILKRLERTYENTQIVGNSPFTMMHEARRTPIPASRQLSRKGVDFAIRRDSLT